MDPDQALLVLLSSESYLVSWVDQLQLRLLGQRQLLAPLLLWRLNLLLDMESRLDLTRVLAYMHIHISAGTESASASPIAPGNRCPSAPLSLLKGRACPSYTD